MAFTPIETQEQLDEIIKARLERERKTLTEKYQDYDEIKKRMAEIQKENEGLAASVKEAAEKMASHEQEIAERDAKIKGYETASVKTRIAHEMGLSYEAINYLQGTEEDDVRKSAEGLKALVGARRVPPLADPEEETAKGDKNKAALKEMLKNLKGE